MEGLRIVTSVTVSTKNIDHELSTGPNCIQLLSATTHITLIPVKASSLTRGQYKIGARNLPSNRIVFN